MPAESSSTTTRRETIFLLQHGDDDGIRRFSGHNGAVDATSPYSIRTSIRATSDDDRHAAWDRFDRQHNARALHVIPPGVLTTRDAPIM